MLKLNGLTRSHCLPMLVIAVLSLGALMAPAYAATTMFEIEPQDLSGALKAFAVQSHREIFFAPELARGRQSRGVKGKFDDLKALNLLLEGTGLNFSVTASNAILVRDPATRGESLRDGVTPTTSALTESQSPPMKLAQTDSAQNLNDRNTNVSDLKVKEEDGAKLDEIVVTATKRSESLSKVSLAVSAFSQDDLTSAGVVGLADLASAAPNLEIKTLGFASAIQVTIRGITNSDFNPGASPAVATYIDGIYIARPQGLNGDLYDIARVEVLRGPQGTLYGRNATGGNINVVTADPVNSFGSAADVSFGNYNDAQVHGMLNLPITEDLAVRGAFSTHRSDGYFDSEGSISHDYGAADDYAGRLTVMWTPADFFRSGWTSGGWLAYLSAPVS